MHRPPIGRHPYCGVAWNRHRRPSGDPQRGLFVALERDLLVQQDVADRYATRAEAQPLGWDLVPFARVHPDDVLRRAPANAVAVAGRPADRHEAPGAFVVCELLGREARLEPGDATGLGPTVYFVVGLVDELMEWHIR